MKPLTVTVTDYDVQVGGIEKPIGYRFVRRSHAMRTETWARWWLAPLLRAWDWYVEHVVFGWVPHVARWRMRLHRSGIGCLPDGSGPWALLFKWRYDQSAVMSVTSSTAYADGYNAGLRDGAIQLASLCGVDADRVLGP